MIAAVIGLLLPVAGTWLSLLALRLRRTSDSALVTMAVSIGCGLALSSAATFWCVVMGIPLSRRFAMADALIWTAIGVAAWWAWRRNIVDRRNAATNVSSVSRLTTADWLVRAMFGVIAAIALATTVAHYVASPHGEWDAWAIWNQKARFLIRDTDHWTELMLTRGATGGHPLFVPLSVARLWAYAGSETTLVPAMLGIVWGIGIVTAVIGAIGTHRRRAWIAGSVVVAPGSFAQLMAAQTADLPMAFFVVTTLVMMRSAGALASTRSVRDARSALVIAGVLASAGAWTKNEGMLLLVGTAVVVAWLMLRRGAVLTTAWYATAAVPVCATLLWFKALAPPVPGYMSETQTAADVVARLVDPQRHKLVVDLIDWRWITWGGPLAAGSLPLMMVAAAFAAFRRDRSARAVLVVVCMMFAGYYAVWVFSPIDTAWLVATTFDRLLMQIWPSLVLVAFSAGAVAHHPT